MGWFRRRIQSDVVLVPPPVVRPADLVVNIECVPPLEAEGGHVETNGRLPGIMGVKVDDDQDAVVVRCLPSPLGKDHDFVAVRVVKAEVAQPVHGRMFLPYPVQHGQIWCQ